MQESGDCGFTPESGKCQLKLFSLIKYEQLLSTALQWEALKRQKAALQVLFVCAFVASAAFSRLIALPHSLKTGYYCVCRQ